MKRSICHRSCGRLRCIASPHELVRLKVIPATPDIRRVIAICLPFAPRKDTERRDGDDRRVGRNWSASTAMREVIWKELRSVSTDISRCEWALALEPDSTAAASAAAGTSIGLVNIARNASVEALRFDVSCRIPSIRVWLALSPLSLLHPFLHLLPHLLLVGPRYR